MTTLSNTVAKDVEPQAATSQRQRWQYAIAMLGVTMPGQVFGVSLLFFYADIKGLPPVWASTALTLYAIYNAVNNPLIGYFQDKTRWKLGRRIPYLRYGALPYMIMFAALWLAPFDGRTQPVPLLIYFIAVIVIYDAMNTAVSNSYYALLPEMFVNYRERTDVAAKMMIFLTVALLLGVALPPVISGQLGWGPMGVIFALISLIAIWVGQRAMFETNKAPLSEMSFLEALKNTFVNRSFLAVTAAQTMRFVTTNGMAAGMSFFVKYALKLEGSQTSLILATVFIVSALMLYPWRQLIANRFEPRTTSLLAYLAVALGVSTLWFAVDLTSTLISSIIIGIGFAGIFLMDNILIADVVDEDETKTGTRREGMFFGVNSFVTTLSTAIVSIAFGAITSAFGYDPALPTQPESAGQGFRVFMALLPTLGCVTAFLILLAYPLHGARLREMKRQLVQLRMSKPGAQSSS